MGEIADAMLDGTLCSCCGTYLADEGVGYPVTCAGCGGGDLPEIPRRRRERPAPPPKPARKPTTERMTSPLNIAARILARMPVTEAEQRILAHFALNNVGPKLRADLAAAFPPSPTAAQEGQGNG